MEIWAIGYYNIDDEFVLVDLALDEEAAAQSVVDHEGLYHRSFTADLWYVG